MAEEIAGRKIIAVVSGKGGVGKTVTALNLGLALSRFKQVTVVDADVNASNLALHMGVTWFPVTLQDVLSGSAGIRDAVYQVQGLNIVPSSLSLSYLNSSTRSLKSVLPYLEGTIIIDSPAGLGRDVMNVLDACTDVIIVTTPEIPSMTNAIKMLKVAQISGKNSLGILINRYHGLLRKEHIADACNAPIIGVVPEERNMSKSAFEKKPILLSNPSSRASVEFMRIASEISGNVQKQYGLLRRIFAVRL